MRPIDLRDATFESLSQDYLVGARRALYLDLLQRGPATTRALAERTGISIFTVRPRVTELVQIGIAECADAEGREGVYRALPETEWRRDTASHQLQLI